jgi:resuscitation-promoting factor RpfA
VTSIDGMAGPAAGWAALAVAAYLALGLAATVLSCRSGVARRWADGLLVGYPRVARVAFRSLAVAALGIGAATPARSALAAPGEGGRPRPPVVAPARPGAEPLDWPAPSPAARQPARAAAPRPVRSQDRPARATVTVRPGDCLWSLAARSLGPDADTAQVATQWPHWWAANRAVIGADPDLLRPGLRLQVPAVTERSAS